MPPKISEKPETQTAELEEPATGFKVLHKFIELKAADKSNPPIFGDVARTTGHGLVARVAKGDFVSLYQWNAALHSLGEQLGRTVDGVELLNYWKGRLGTVGFHRYGPSSVEADALRFAGMFPDLARAVGWKDQYAPDPLFQSPENQTQKGPHENGVDLNTFTRKHMNGDFGENGQADMGHVLTEEELFTLEIEPVAMQNATAIKRRKGCVRSCYKSRHVEINALTVFPTDKAECVKTLCWVTPPNYR
jgi:hypothetical protein